MNAEKSFNAEFGFKTDKSFCRSPKEGAKSDKGLKLSKSIMVSCQEGAELCFPQ
jgi:hypothetical protein